MQRTIIREKERLALKATHFAVAHGMHHDRNYSTALDIATLSWNALRSHPLFA
jgi:D-alanyl-D-alanine carboxypeptidase